MKLIFSIVLFSLLLNETFQMDYQMNTQEKLSEKNLLKANNDNIIEVLRNQSSIY